MILPIQQQQRRPLGMTDWLWQISPSLRLAGHAATRADWVEARRVIYDHELVLFEGADYEVLLGDEKFRCPAGSFLVVPPGRPHVSRQLSARPGHRYWIHFDWVWQGDASQIPVLTYMPATPQREFFRPAPAWVPHEILRGPLPSIDEALDIFRRLENRWNFGSGRDRSVSRGIFLELLLTLLAPESEALPLESAAASLAAQTRRRLNQYAETPLGKSPPLQSFLAQTGLTYAHQCRVFKKAYGLSPLRYVHELRLVRIKNLLKATRLPVSAIAEQAGFSSLGYFSRFFKRYTGQNPSHYRNQVLP